MNWQSQRDRRRGFFALLINVVLIGTSQGAAFGQSISAPTSTSKTGLDGDSIALPGQPVNWINSAPINLESMRGKGVFLWYFEETCPKCSATWPMLLETAKKYQGQPVMFMAVNSGTTRAAVDTYVREHGIRWPVLVDPSREFEKKSGVNTISLQNIYQARIITPEGRIERASWDDIDASVERALEGAKWNVDPAGIPPEMRQAWAGVEFGNYPSAASAITRALKTSNDETKSAAERLMAAVQEQMDVAVHKAAEVAESGDRWQAYKSYAQISERFSGFPLPSDVAAKKSALASDSEVKGQLSAMQILENAKKMAATGRTTSINRARSILQRIARESSNTEAGQEAAALLAGNQDK